MSSTLSKVKVGRKWGYPIIVTTGKSEHEAILLECDNDDNPQEFLDRNLNVKIRWKVAGYDDDVSTSSIELMNVGGTQNRPRRAAKYSPSKDTDIPSMKEDNVKPSVVTSGVAVKTEDVETDSDEERTKNEKTSYYGNDSKSSAVTSGVTVKTEDVETDSDEDHKLSLDNRKPDAVPSGSSALKMEDQNDTDADDDYDEFINDGCLRIPRVKCTNASFFKYSNRLSIRELICWALRTETNIRLAKVEGRMNQSTNNDDNDNNEEEDYSYNKTLNSNYLIDIYPESSDGLKKSSDEGKEGRGRRDEYKFSRKVHPQFKFVDDEPNLTSGSNNDDFDGLTPITIQKPTKRRRSDEEDDDNDDGGSDSDIDGDSESWDNFVGKQVVPPTLLHFEIILEAYMGYNLSSSSTTGCVSSDSDDDNITSQPSFYHHPDSSMPRSAVMGGAVVAALTAYRYEVVVRAFNLSGLFTEEGALQMGDVQYWSRKMALMKSLHTHFIYKKKVPTYGGWGFQPAPPEPCNSKYSDGDVDIFLQASPLSQGIVHALNERGIVDQSIISLIGSYVGNAGLCDADLGRFTKYVINDTVQPRKPSDYPAASLAYTVSKNAVSFILGKDDRDDHIYGNQNWPRTSQFILLDAQADLLGGLMDFDLSVAACSYDGVTVRVAPIAALSLMTNAQFITPFCLEEHRNKRRVIKYARRGFKPFLVDPYDNRPQQKVACDAEIMRRPFLPPRSSRYEARGPDGDARRNEILRIQDMKGGPKAGRFCCHTFDGMDGDMLLGHDARNTYRYEGIKYTQMLFEISEGDALDFFSKRFNWTEEDSQTVKSIDPHCRMSCRRCKWEYLLIRVVLKHNPALLTEYVLEDDNLRGDFSYRQGYFSPSFYSGGVFSGTGSRDNASRTVEIVSMLRAQSIFEVSSYVLKHGSPDGYKKRFVYGSDEMVFNGIYRRFGLPWILEKASQTSLQEPKRPPIGLNPERFVERCGQCKSWLLGNRYGTKDCQHCSSQN